MPFAQGIIIMWLVLLTLSVIALYGAVDAKWRDLRNRMSTLDLAHRVQHITDLLTADTRRENKQLHKALQDAIQLFEANKHLMDRYWHEYQALKALANQAP